MMLWRYEWIAFGVKRLVFVSFYSNRQTIRATGCLFRTMLGKKEVCSIYLLSDCVDKTWFSGPSYASDCNLHLHIFPSFHFTLKKICNGIWITKAIRFNFLLKILYIFRFPIHSDRTAGNRAIRRLLQTKVGLNNNKALLCWRVHVTKHSRPSCFCATS